MTKIKYYESQLNFRKIIESNNELILEQSFIICDLSDVIRKFHIWRKALPRIKPFYAVKCNDDVKILQTLDRLGCGFDCASKGEIMKVKSLNVPSNNIIFAHPCKLISHLKYSQTMGVLKMTFDSEHELIKIKKHYPNAELILRIRCDDTESLLPIGEKFGCDAEQKAPKLLHLARDLNLNLIGICFHVGSGCQEFQVYERAIKAAANLFDLGTDLGLDMHLLDIGGGFPGDSKSKFLQIANVINKALEQYFPIENEVDIVAEPGRYFVESAQTVIADIHSKRELYNNDKLEKIMYFMNDGLYGSLHLLLYQKTELVVDFYDVSDEGKVQKININSEFQNKENKRSTIWGPACNPYDCVIDDINLPDLKLGTKLVISNRGAYSLTLSSGFNGFSLPVIKYYMNSKDKKFFC